MFILLFSDKWRSWLILLEKIKKPVLTGEVLSVAAL